MATKTRASRLAARLRSLEALDEVKASGYETALTALRQFHDDGRQPQSVRVRSRFIEVAPPSTAPPLSLLINSRGYALRVALLALFIAQTRPGSSPHVLDMPLSPTRKRSSQVAWEDLIVTPAGPGAGSASRAVHAKRAGSARSALQRLARPDVSLLELPNSGKRKSGYDMVRLLEDSGPRAVGLPVSYSIPATTKDVVTVPVDFFLKGWVYVLEDTEIATYLMYRRLCAQSSPAHISAVRRGEIFGVKQSAWEQYWVLADSDLVVVEADENRRPDGTFVDMSTGVTPRRHRFTLHDEGLASDALRVVWNTVERRMTAG